MTDVLSSNAHVQRKSGVKACFGNFGSDHPAILEAIAKGQAQHGHGFPQVYTCPNEVSKLQIFLHHLVVERTIFLKILY